MEQRRLAGRRRVGTVLVLMGLLSGMFGLIDARSALADPIPAGNDIADFEIEGNFALDTAGLVDWGSIPDLEARLAFDDDLRDPDPDGEGDEGFVGGAKEFDRSTWGCSDDSGKTPDKDDLKYVLSYPSLSLDEAAVAFAYVRNKSQGNTNVVIELNESPIDSCSTVNDRTPGDLLLHFDFPGGDDVADLEAYVWNGTAFVSFDVPPGVANAITNSASISVPASIADEVADVGLPTTIGARDMGEAAIDLNALQDALEDADIDVDDVLECPGIGAANVRTRSSGDSDTSQLHDHFPQIPIDLSNCGSLKIKKVDDLGAPMEGIQFALFASEADALAGAPIAQLPSNPPEDLVCTTDADGVCELPKVPPGDYYVNELDLPDGYTADPDLPAPVSIDPFEDVDLSDDDNGACEADVTAEGCEWFVNTLRTGTVVITKQVVDGEGDPITPTDITYLDGIAFALEDGGTVVQKRGGGDATCTLDLDDPADTPSCTITDVPFGTYDVVEDATTLPAGLSAGPSVPVTVDEDSPATAEVTYENPADPLNISIDKTGPDTANVGDTITYTFTVGLGDLPFDTTDDVELQPLTEVAVTEVVSAPDFGDRCTASPLVNTDKEDVGPLGDSWLEEGERWTYQCTHVVTAAEALDSDGTSLKNRARVSGKDRYDRTDTDTDDHVVTILLPDLQVVKLAADGVDAGGAASDDETVDAPGTATYTITVTNVGAGVARNATLTDTLPAGSWTVSLAGPDGNDVCPVGGNPRSGSFSCTFGDLAPGASKTVTVSRTVTIADDCAAVLENNAGVTTTYQSLDIDPNSANDSSEATINVRCPDVGVVKSATNTPISAGERAEWSITVTNNGAGVAEDVFLVDTVPAQLSDLELGGADAADCDLDGHDLTCDFGDLPGNDGAPGGPDTRVITVSGLTGYADCGTIPNTATVASDAEGGAYEDSNPDNNSSTANVVVQCPDLTLTKAAGAASVSAGSPISFTITATNSNAPGTGTALGVTLDDPLPEGSGVVWTEESPDCSITDNVLSCSFGDLVPGESATVTVTSPTTEASCKRYPNTAELGATNHPSLEASASTVVECPDISITKEADDQVVSAGDPIAFAITVRNAPGAGTATAVTLDDPLPGGDGVFWAIESQSGGAGCKVDGLAGAQVLTCGPVELAPGASFSVTIASPTDPTTDDCVSAVLQNTATSDASNDAPVTASDSVQILCPGVNLGKVADETVVEAGDELGFTITVTNLDDGVPPAEGVARNVVVEDELPGDVDWQVAGDSDLPEGATCDIEEGVLTCELGDLDPVGAEAAPQVSIHVVAPTTPADCATYDNTATATVDDGADPDDASASARVRCPLEIDLDKTGDTIAHVGDTVGYEFTVTNVGGEDLVDVELTDPECDAGTIALVDDGDGDDVLAAGTWDGDSFEGGEVWSYTCERTLTAEDVVVVDGEDHALNTGTVTAEDADGRPTDDTDPHDVLIITPDIEVVKTVDDETPSVGQTVTFTYVVTNTGNTTLFGVDVDDDQLGPIGTIDELAPGESATLTKTMEVAADSPTRNVATADGEDVLGKHVDDDDDATITIVAGNVIVPGELPRTGADLRTLVVFAGAVLALGGVLLLLVGNRPFGPRRRRHLA